MRRIRLEKSRRFGINWVTVSIPLFCKTPGLPVIDSLPLNKQLVCQTRGENHLRDITGVLSKCYVGQASKKASPGDPRVCKKSILLNNLYHFWHFFLARLKRWVRITSC